MERNYEINFFLKINWGIEKNEVFGVTRINIKRTKLWESLLEEK